MPDYTELDASPLLLAWNHHRDEVAFTQFVYRYLGMVQGAALRKTGSAELAEEVAQAVFALAARRAAALAEHPCIGAWLHRTAVLESSNALRRDGKHRKLAAKMLMDPPTSPEPTEPHSALPHLDDALDALPEHDRRAVLLRFSEKQSYDQMAAHLGKSADACQKQTSRALEQLRTILTRRMKGLTATGLAAGLSSALNSPATASASSVSAAAIAAAPQISLFSIIHHILRTMTTAKQITTAAGLVALLSSVPLSLVYGEAADLRGQLAKRPSLNSAATPATSTPALSVASRFGPPGSRIQPGVSPAEADRTLTMLRGLRGKMLTSSQLIDVAAQIMALPISHMEQALASVADFPGLFPVGALQVMIFARWGELAPESAIAALAQRKLNPMIEAAANMGLVSGWMERDPLGMTAWLKANAQSPSVGNLSTMLSSSGYLTQFDKATIEQLCHVKPNGEFPGALELKYEMEIENGNVLGVARKLLAQTPDGPAREALLFKASQHIASKNPKAALDFVLAHPDSQGNLASFALANTVQVWAQQDLDAATAWVWTWKQQTKGDDPTSKVWEIIAKKSYDEIQLLLATAPTEAARQHALYTCAMYAGQNAEKSLRLIGLLKDDSRHRALADYGRNQGRLSAEATAQILITLPAGADKDATIRGFAPVLAETEPDSATIWAASIQDEAQRSTLVRQLGRQWYQKEPEAAKAWLEKTKTLTHEDHAAITGNP